MFIIQWSCIINFATCFEKNSKLAFWSSYAMMEWVYDGAGYHVAIFKATCNLDKNHTTSTKIFKSETSLRMSRCITPLRLFSNNSIPPCVRFHLYHGELTITFLLFKSFVYQGMTSNASHFSPSFMLQHIQRSFLIGLFFSLF